MHVVGQTASASLCLYKDIRREDTASKYLCQVPADMEIQSCSAEVCD